MNRCFTWFRGISTPTKSGYGVTKIESIQSVQESASKKIDFQWL